MKAARIATGEIIDLAPEVITLWSTDDPPNPKLAGYSIAPSDAHEWNGTTWALPPEPEPPTRRVWANNRAFWETFTPTEQNAIAAAAPGLSVTLAMWDGEVWSDDEHIQAAMAALVQANVLTTERANEIITPPGLL